MPSAIESAIDQYRQRLLAGDAAAISRTAAAYAKIRATLIDRLDELVKIATANAGLSGTELLNLERVVSLLEDIETAIDALSGPTERFVTAAQRQAVQLALETAQGLMVAQKASIATSFNRVNIEAVNSQIGRLTDGSPLKDYLDSLGSKASKAIADGLVEGIGTGVNPDELARRLAKDLDLVGWKLAQTTRTSMLNSYRDATCERMKANRDILSGWRWLASLSSRTCRACLGMHMSIHDVDEPMHSHNSCRCTQAPIVKGVDFPSLPTGDEWLRSQPEKIQHKVIPVSAFDEFKAGDLILDDFAALHKDNRWGDSYQEATLVQVRRNAQRRDRIAA